VDALSGVDLEIARGELVVLLGPSGSGKTTLLNVIGGIEPATSGTVDVAGVDLVGLDDDGRTAYRRDHIGFVFQFFNLIPALTAHENVQLVAELTGHDATRTAETLAVVGLAERADHFPSELSGGEQQRVAISRALAPEPDLLLCDEPTGALDLETGRQVLGVLQHRNRERATTVVNVTHTAIAAMADRVVRLRSGAIVEVTHNDEPCDAAEVTW
ncbi:MAG TPA: ABC transporter ATP-binding protein, partial [Euzebyales bacterium]|nr:ABC transporter ATP-binding protein [Euzebyales bacterium]